MRGEKTKSIKHKYCTNVFTIIGFLTKAVIAEIAETLNETAYNATDSFQPVSMDFCFYSTFLLQKVFHLLKNSEIKENSDM